jgi:hypothetical protein
MIKHEINFNGKKLALDKKEILELLPELEPYYVGIMMGTTDFELPQFVKDYKSNISDNRNRVKKAKSPKKGKENAPEEENSFNESNVYELNHYRKEKQSNG